MHNWFLDGLARRFPARLQVRRYQIERRWEARSNRSTSVQPRHASMPKTDEISWMARPPA